MSAKRTVNGVPLPDGVNIIVPKEVEVMAEWCASNKLPFIYVGGIAELFKTDQDKEAEAEAERKVQIVNYLDSNSTPLRPADRAKIIEMDMKGYDDEFAMLLDYCQKQNWPMVKGMFESKMVQPHVITTGWDPLHVVARYGGGDILRWLSKLEGSKVDFNARGFTGKTPLHYAIGGFNRSSINALLELKVDTTIKDNAGMLAIDCVCPDKKPMDLSRLSPDNVIQFQQCFRDLEKLLPTAQPHIRALADRVLAIRNFV